MSEMPELSRDAILQAIFYGQEEPLDDLSPFRAVAKAQRDLFRKEVEELVEPRWIGDYVMAGYGWNRHRHAVLELVPKEEGK